MTETTRLCRGSGRESWGRPPGGHGMRRPAEKPANPRFPARGMITKG
ncbi:hypothetical protein ABZS79_25795 [Streptomyces griseoloalbus]